MIRKLIWLAVTSGVAARVYQHLAGRQRQAREAVDHRQALHTWEDEGGALPPKNFKPQPATQARANGVTTH